MYSRGIPITAPTLLALQAFMQTHPAAGSLGEIVDAALNAWLARQGAVQEGAPGVGYQWKCLFLPAGTQVRFDYAGGTYRAEVRGDRLIYAARPTSPRGMLMAIAGLTGNAWTLLRVRRPGDKHFHVPAALRAQQARDDATEGCTAEHALTRRVVDALGRIEGALRQQRDLLDDRHAARRERRHAAPRRGSDHSPAAPPRGATSEAAPTLADDDHEPDDDLNDIAWDALPSQHNGRPSTANRPAPVGCPSSTPSTAHSTRVVRLPAAKMTMPFRVS